MNRTAELKNEQIEIHFNYDPGLIGLLKNEVPGRKWESISRCWTAPMSKQLINFLHDNQFTFDQNLLTAQKQREKEKEKRISQTPKLPDTLFPFQKEGVKFIQKTDGHALIGDEMGLGKTIQALSWIHYCLPKKSPVIIIVPAAVKLLWQRMTTIWAPDRKTTIIYGSQSSKDLESLLQYDTIIINYDLLIKNVKDSKIKLSEALTTWINPELLVIDESHFIANPKTQRTKAIRKMTKGKKIIALSGTPITSRPIQFYSVLNLLCPEDFPSLWAFAHRYCGAKHNGFGWDFSGTSNVEELHKKLTDTCMIRRLKKDVMTDLPNKLRDVIPLKINNFQEYQNAEKDFIGWLNAKGKIKKANRAKQAKALSQMEELKQLAVRGKLIMVVEWINNFLEEAPDEKLILFTHHIKIRDRLYEHYKKEAVVALGGNSTQKAVDEFQNNPKIRLFIGNIDSAGIGITLTAANTVAFVELAWTPGKMQQAEDRAHRIGQKKCVNIHYLIAEKTIEEDIATILDKKTKVLNRVLDGKKTEKDSLIAQLLKKYKKQKGHKQK